MADRNDPMVQAWIDRYAKINAAWGTRPDCPRCGFPHHANVLTCQGATWGAARLGGHEYFVDSQNADYMQKFVKSMGGGFHWRDEVWFERTGDGVKVSRIEPFNNTPHIKSWLIPWREWQSITEYASGVALTHPARFRPAQDAYGEWKDKP